MLYCVQQLHTIICTCIWAVFTVTVQIHTLPKAVDKYQQFVEQWPHPWTSKLVLTNQQINIPLPWVRWHCRLSITNSIWPVKIWIDGGLAPHGYLPRVSCRWFSYGPADATDTPSFLASLKYRKVLYLYFWESQPFGFWTRQGRTAENEMPTSSLIWPEPLLAQ